MSFRERLNKAVINVTIAEAVFWGLLLVLVLIVFVGRAFYLAAK